MATKSKKQVQDAPESTEIVETIETIAEASNEAPEAVKTESECITEAQAELKALREQISASRAEFVTQTDKQFAKIAELDVKIADKQICVDNYTQICDVFLPAKQKELAEANNEALRIRADAETSLKEVLVREKTLDKATAELAKQKEALDIKSNELNLLATSLEQKDKELKEREKASD